MLYMNQFKGTVNATTNEGERTENFALLRTFVKNIQQGVTDAWKYHTYMYNFGYNINILTHETEKAGRVHIHGCYRIV